MSWFTTTLSSSVGKKLLMALTGFAFLGFLAAHLAGNLTIYGGREAFNGYAERLHAFDKPLLIFEVGLAAFALVHVGTGLILFWQNRKARPVAYAGRKSAGGQTLASTTMPYTGILILAFVFSGLFLAGGPAFLLPLALLAAFFSCINFGAFFHLASTIIETESLATLIGFINFLANVGAVLFTLLFGVSKDATGTFAWGFGVLAVLAFGSFAVGQGILRKDCSRDSCRMK